MHRGAATLELWYHCLVDNYATFFVQVHHLHGQYIDLTVDEA